MAALIILSWFAPPAVALGIHVHELLEHAHHELLEHAHDTVAEPGPAVHDEGHDHDVPSIAREIAPPVRVGRQNSAPSPALTTLPPVLCPVPGSLIASGAPAADQAGPREGPPLSILHCSFLI